MGKLEPLFKFRLCIDKSGEYRSHHLKPKMQNPTDSIHRFYSTIYKKRYLKLKF